MSQNTEVNRIVPYQAPTEIPILPYILVFKWEKLLLSSVWKTMSAGHFCFITLTAKKKAGISKNLVKMLANGESVVYNKGVNQNGRRDKQLPFIKKRRMTMLNLIPKPLHAEEKDGTLSFSKKTKLTGAFDGLFSVLGKMLPKANEAGENTLTFVHDIDVPAEGYRIACENGDITVSASDESGAFYAVMTLLQLAGGKDTIPTVEMEDAPRFHYRGFMLDCARHFWTVDKIKQILDVMARIKMNIFHWHLTEDQGWRIEIKKYPLLTPWAPSFDTPGKLYLLSVSWFPHLLTEVQNVSALSGFL